ncbi:YcjX family protein [Paraferrimonas sedimenticola]|uniref:ATPase n=1 Tax=Paraferrimonas sedimenticola TaxID=375674 RepID=A0AA37RSI7_9GAMM|nr:YcjX family protein [Paraferrimonas sedimenticola]GLP94834.1 ATPase [Paraferrimonas sedimenticola]
MKAGDILTRIASKSQQLAVRSLDKQVKLAVTGLSGAGKTTFITGLVNQLLNASPESLPLWDLAREGRLVSVTRVPQPDLNIASFDYQSALSQLSAQPPAWPHSTRKLTQIRLAIRYRSEHPLWSTLSDTQTLYLDIVDYPGEWLLDLPMLAMDYRQWSQTMAQVLELCPQAELDKFRQACQALGESVGDETLARVSEQYRDLLLYLKHERGLSYLQPGRLILPGDLEGTPLISFFPWLEAVEDWDDLPESSVVAQLQQRYSQYQSQVVKRFYRDHFRYFDRQLVLVDCLSPLSRGEAEMRDTAKALGEILQHFHYGERHWLTQIFSPKIDKLVFAASKADHVSYQQRPQLLNLLENMLAQSRQELQLQGTQIHTQTLASIRATSDHQVDHQGQTLPVISGTPQGEQAGHFYPGDLPPQWPDSDYWTKRPFQHMRFLPQPLHKGQARHLGLDALLQQLLGDKLK